MVESKKIRCKKLKCEDALAAMRRFIDQGEKINILLQNTLNESKSVCLDDGHTVYDWLVKENHMLDKVYYSNLKSFYDAEQIFYQYSKFVKNSIGVKNNKIKKKFAMNEEQLQEARELIEKYNLKRDIVANKYKISVSTLRKYLKNGVPEEEKIGLKNIFENINDKLENDLSKKIDDVQIDNNKISFSSMKELERHLMEEDKAKNVNPMNCFDSDKEKN